MMNNITMGKKFVSFFFLLKIKIDELNSNFDENVL